MTTKISGDNISAIANQGVTWNAVTVADGSTTVNASAGEGYFLDTNAGVIEVFLPTSPTQGDTVILVDYAGTFATNNVIVNSGTNNIDSTVGSEFILSTNNRIAEFVYVDSNKGWLYKGATTKGSTPSQAGVPLYDTDAEYISATGGTIITSGDYKTHVFTGDGCFVVSCGGNPAGSDTVDYLVVAGGGGTNWDRDAGGGAGGFRLSNSVGCVPAPTMSPLSNPTGITVSTTTYPITVGGGGAAIASYGTTNPGSNSIFSSITSAGGGGSKQSGGSGGGGWCGPVGGGAGNTPPTSPPQGNPGGNGLSTTQGTGGGGGAGATGQHGQPGDGGNGGIGSYVADSFIGPTAPSYGESGPVGSTRYFAGGGGGAKYPSGPGGTGGTGGGGDAACGGAFVGTSGTANTGGGAGGSGANGGVAPNGASGGKGIVILRYKFQ